jgi:hypothetical protein
MEQRRTDHKTFWIPILTYLERNGGSAHSDGVYKYVRETLPLNVYDLTIIDGSAPEPYWRKGPRRNKLNNDIPLSPHKPEAPAKADAGLRWRFRLVART